jgi:hypothetical protein
MKPPPNRRVGRRRKAKQSIKAICIKGTLGLGKNIALSTLDVSEVGAHLIVKEELKLGQDVEVTLESAVTMPIKRVGKVVRCEIKKDGSYSIGIRFDRFLPYSAWQSMTTSE